MGNVQNDTDQFTITIPLVFCSFPWRNHPEYAHKLKEMSDAWVVERCKNMPAACKGERATSFFSADRLIGSGDALCVASYFANAASTSLLLPILKLMSWYFMLDYFMDDPSEMGADPARASYVIERMVAVFAERSTLAHCVQGLPSHEISSPSIHECGSLKHVVIENTLQYHEKTPARIATTSSSDELAVRVLTECAMEWWGDMCVDMRAGQQARFADAFIGYLRANLLQIPFRAAHNNIMPDLHTYMRIHSQSVGWYPLGVLTEYSLRMEMDEEALMHPLLVALKESVCKHTVLANDVFSFGKEYAEGDTFNVVFVLCFNKLRTALAGLHENASWRSLLSPALLQEAMLEACEMVKEADQECARLMEKIKECAVLMEKPGMADYLEAMGNYVSGNVYWSLATKRYSISSAPQPYDNVAPRHLHLITRPHPLVPHVSTFK